MMRFWKFFKHYKSIYFIYTNLSIFVKNIKYNIKFIFKFNINGLYEYFPNKNMKFSCVLFLK